MAKTKKKADFGTPASQPMALLYQSNGHYHYSSFCCDNNDAHYGVVTTTTPLQENQMGCPVNSNWQVQVEENSFRASKEGSTKVASSKSERKELNATAARNGKIKGKLDKVDYYGTCDAGTISGSAQFIQNPANATEEFFFRLLKPNNSKLPDYLTRYYFRLVRVPRPKFEILEIVDNRILRTTHEYPSDIYFADCCTVLGLVPPEVDLYELTVDKYRGKKKANAPEQNIHRMKLLEGENAYDTWVISLPPTALKNEASKKKKGSRIS
jgi:hypothetical protein